jgi:CheY-like chemotaxis protein
MSVPLLTAWTKHAPLALLVDRDEDTRQMYADYLRLSSCVIEEATDGREALAKALALNPDVVITETRLPGIDGFALCDLLRQDPATHSIPIIVVTGDAFDGDLQRAQRAGADSVLVKPCLPENLLGEMQRLLDTGVELRERTRNLLQRTDRLRAKSDELIARSHDNFRRAMLSRAHDRRDTNDPPLPPPGLVCPSCDQPLRYKYSHIGGVSARHSEQWDYFECQTGCGAFQYRQRTRKVRKV